MFRVGDRVMYRSGKGPVRRGAILLRTWENGSHVLLDDGEEVIARHENLTNETSTFDTPKEALEAVVALTMQSLSKGEGEL